MKVLFWVPYPTKGASNRHRVEQYLPYLKKAGIRYALRPFWSGTAYNILYKKGRYVRKAFFFILGSISRFFGLFEALGYDIVFIHREACPVGTAFFESILYVLKKPLIFDFDDAIFLPPPTRPNEFIEKFKKPDNAGCIIRMSAHTIAGNKYLSEFTLRHSSAVSIIPTSIDTDIYYPRTAGGDNGRVVVGWMGSVTSLPLLEAMKSIFIRLSVRFDNIGFKIVGGNFSISGFSKVVSKKWSSKEEIDDLKSFNIGIMPMPDSEWTKGKCGFKAILYMGMGIPCVCSPVGMNKEIITDGVNGFLASTEDEWVEKLSFLIESPQLRNKLGAAGRKTVEERYSVNINAPKFLDVLKGVYGQGKG